MSSLITKAVPSEYEHTLWELDEDKSEYGASNLTFKGTTTDPQPGANLVSSNIPRSNDHTVMVDIDVPAAMIPSSTPGHHHLYIDVRMPWRKYKRLLRELARAGIIEEGYYKASVRRKHSALRMRGHTRKTPRPVPFPSAATMPF